MRDIIFLFSIAPAGVIHQSLCGKKSWVGNAIAGNWEAVMPSIMKFVLSQEQKEKILLKRFSAAA